MTHPYQQPDQPIEKRVEDLLSRMTMQDKVGQLNQVQAFDQAAKAVPDLIREGKIGSRILAGSPYSGNEKHENATVREHNELAKLAQESRLGIPFLNGRDVIHGHRTVFPIPLAQAATWDIALIEEGSAVAAREARTHAVHWTFAPMLDLARDPRWGRVIEGGGEDPHLIGAMGAAMVRGFQGRTPAELKRKDKVLACAKHFAAYGTVEGGRDYNSGELSESTLRNFYLPPFRAALEAGAATVMSGFHDFNGEPTSGSRYLLTQILRDEWGFDGFVISDWESVGELVNHRVAADRSAAAEIGLSAGVDLDMCAFAYINHVADLVAAGKISQATLDEAVRRILRAKFRLGLFEDPFTDENAAGTTLLHANHRALARRMAGRSMVLLKNQDGILPLPRQGLKVALVGPYVRDKLHVMGNWSMDGLARDTVSIEEGIRAAAPDLALSVVDDFDDALRAVQRADAVILVVGETHGRTGENNCVSDIVLPFGQEELVRRATQYAKPVVLVVCAGRPLAITEAARTATAILWAWHPGTEAGHAVADILFGAVNPSGKLPITFPRATGQIPIYYNHKTTGRIWEGSGWYTDLPNSPLYPFGYGLSFTTFEYADIRVKHSVIATGGTTTVSAKVTNTGVRAGEEVVQCYVQDCVASITRPVRELKAFTRIELQPGETREVFFDLDEKAFGFHSRRGWTVEPGDFRIWIGGSSAATLESRVTVGA